MRTETRCQVVIDVMSDTTPEVGGTKRVNNGRRRPQVDLACQVSEGKRDQETDSSIIIVGLMERATLYWVDLWVGWLLWSEPRLLLLLGWSLFNAQKKKLKIRAPNTHAVILIAVR